MDEFRIPATNLPRLQEEVASLQKKAKHLGLQEITLVIDRQETVKQQNHLGFESTARYCICHIEGESPKLNGWRLLGVIEPQPTGENLLRMVPGNECPEKYRTTSMFCEHCKTDRRRNMVCLLEHDDGTVIQVGRNCLKDFLGHDSPESLLRDAMIVWRASELGEEAGDESWGSGTGGNYLYAEAFLTTVAVVMRRFGWVPRSQADLTHQATADLAWTIQIDYTDAMKQFIREHQIYASKKDEELAHKAIEWAKDIDPKVANDYLYNLGVAARVAFETGTVDRKTYGVLASAISGYSRELEKQFEAKGKLHLGTVGKREVFESLTVASIRPFESGYGPKHLIKMLDPAGNVLVWWASVDPQGLGLEIGKSFRAKATVREHSVYQGMKQTEVQRLVVLEPVGV